jgi:hypothetical protein
MDTAEQHVDDVLVPDNNEKRQWTFYFHSPTAAERALMDSEETRWSQPSGMRDSDEYQESLMNKVGICDCI